MSADGNADVSTPHLPVSEDAQIAQKATAVDANHRVRIDAGTDHGVNLLPLINSDVLKAQIEVIVDREDIQTFTFKDLMATLTSELLPGEASDALRPHKEEIKRLFQEIAPARMANAVQRDRPPPEGEPPTTRQRSDGDAQDTMDFDMEEEYEHEQAIADELHGGGLPAPGGEEPPRVPGLDDESQAGADANAADIDELASQGGDEPANEDGGFDEQGLRAKVFYSDADPDWDALDDEFAGSGEYTAWRTAEKSKLIRNRAAFIKALQQVERAGSFAEVLGIDDHTGDLDAQIAAQKREHKKLSKLLHPDKHGSAPPDFKERVEAAMQRLNNAKEAPPEKLDEPFDDVAEEQQDGERARRAGEWRREEAARQQAAEDKRTAARERAEAASKAASEFQQSLRAVVRAPRRATEGMQPWPRACGGGRIKMDFVRVNASKVPEYGTMHRSIYGGLIEIEPTRENILLVEAGCSSEKTRTLMRWLLGTIDDETPVIFITTRKTHADDTVAVLDDFDLFAQYGFKNYLDATACGQGKREFLEKAPRLIVSLQSLHLVELDQFHGGIVIMDEVRSLASIVGGKTLPEPILTMQVALRTLCTGCQYRIAMDADISCDGAVEALLRVIAPNYNVLHVQLTQAALKRTMSLAFTGPKGSTGKEVHTQWLKLWLLRARETHVPLAREHRESAARRITCAIRLAASRKVQRAETIAEKRVRLIAAVRQVALRLKTQRTVGRVLICCATPKLARKAAKRCDALDVRYHFYDGGSSDKEKRTHFKNTTEHWRQAEVVIATTTLCVAVNVRIHFACAFIYAQTSDQAGKLRELLQAAVRVGRDPNDPLEDIRIFTLIPGAPPNVPDIVEKCGGQLPTQDKRFDLKLKDKKHLDEEVMRVEHECNAKGRELYGVVGEAAGSDAMLSDRERVGARMLELMAWNELEMDENGGSRALLKLVELCALPTRSWPIELLQKMSEEEAVELATLEQEVKDIPNDERHAVFTEDQRIKIMNPREKYEWIRGTIDAKARSKVQAREQASHTVLDDAQRASILEEETDQFFACEAAGTRGRTQARLEGTSAENAREMVFNVLEHLWDFPDPKDFSIMTVQHEHLVRRMYMSTVPLDEQQKVYEYLRQDGKTPHPMVEHPPHFTHIKLEKLASVLKLPSIDSLLHEMTFTDEHEWVQAFNRLKRGDESHKTADESMATNALTIAKDLGAKVTTQMGMQKIIERVLIDVCAMAPDGCKPEGLGFMSVSCGARTADGRACQLTEWTVHELLPHLTPKLRLMLMTPKCKIEHVSAGKWRARFDQLYNQARERQRWQDDQQLDDDEQLDADMRDAVPATFAQPNLDAWAAPLQRRFNEWSKIERYHDAPLQLWASDLQSDEGWRRDGARQVFDRLAAIRPPDMGFKSAGILFLVRGSDEPQVLLAKERRGSHTRLNFLGGKREGNETPRQTAAREAWEETKVGGSGGGLIDSDLRDRLAAEQGIMLTEAWAEQSKYVAYVHELTADGIAERVAGLSPNPVPTVQRLASLELVPLASLVDVEWVQANTHYFCREQLNALRPWLVAYLGVGAATQQPPPPPPAPPQPVSPAVIAEVAELEATHKKLKRCEGFHTITHKLASLPLDAASGRRVQTMEYEQKGVGGRRYAMGESICVGGGDAKPRSVTGQGMYNDLRAVVFGATASDVDCENGDFRLVLSLAEQLGLQANVCQVEHYVDHRDDWLREIMHLHGVEKGTAKRLPNVVSNGGGYRTWLRDNGMDLDAPKFEPVLKLQKELLALRAVLFQHPRFKPMIETERARIEAAKEKSAHGIEASLMSRIMQTCENEVLGIIDRVCFDAGFDTLALVFDGLIVEPGIACTINLADVLKTAEQRCAQGGWSIKLAIKPLHGLHQTLDDPPPTIKEAREALRRFEGRIG